MAWIDMVRDEDAKGLLAELFDQARKRAGKVYNILRVQSQNPRTLRSGLDLYIDAMKGDSPLTRVQREMLAVVVSKTNGCHY